MGIIWLPSGGGGGEGSDECTLTLQDVPRGLKAITKDSDDEAREGTLNTETSATDTIVLSGETYMKFNPETQHWEKHTGSLVNRGAWTTRIGINGKAMIPAGFHNGAGYVDQAVTNRGAWTSNVGMNGEIAVPEGYHNGSGKVSGPSVTQRGAVTAALNCGGSYTIPEGYHNGGGKVTANSLASQTSGNAGAADIISGRSSWVNGSKVVGSMADYRSTPTEIDAIRLNNSRFEVAVKAGCHGYSWAGNGYEYMSYAQVASAIGLSAGVIKKGVRIMNLIGTFEGWVPGIEDLYKYGTNTANFIKYTPNNSSLNITYESGMLRIFVEGHWSIYDFIYGTKSYNLSPYSNINIEYSSNEKFSLNIKSGTTQDSTTYAFMSLTNTGINTKNILSLNISAINAIAYVHISPSSMNRMLYVYRIWLS